MINIVSEILTEDLKQKLKVLAGVNESDIIYTDRGFKFTFERSLQANYCRVVQYHDNVIVEMRKKTDNLLEGQLDILVSEKIIKPQEFNEHFQDVSGVYLDYLGL